MGTPFRQAFRETRKDQRQVFDRINAAEFYGYGAGRSSGLSFGESLELAFAGRLQETMDALDEALLRAARDALERVVERGKNYLVPRADGRILVGATEEHAGFDISVDDDASRRLLEEAFLICPGLNRLPVETAWAGLRPGSLDTRPYIGPAPGFPNLLIAAGHNRAGLQLSTGTAVMIADLIDDQPPQIDLSAFRPGRAPIREPPSAIRS